MKTKLTIMMISLTLIGCIDNKLIETKILKTKIIDIDKKNNSYVYVNINNKKEMIFISLFCNLKNDLINKDIEIKQEKYINKDKSFFYTYSKINNKNFFCN